jgi:hypothetical protein
MGIDDESSHPKLCSAVADGVTRNIVCLFREPDAGNLPVRFDEREQETGSSQTGLRRVMRKHPNSHREAKATAPVLDSTRDSSAPKRCNPDADVGCLGIGGIYFAAAAQKRPISWERILALAARWFPAPRVLHPYPAVRFSASHPRLSAIRTGCARPGPRGGRSAMIVPTAIVDRL